MTTYHDHSGNVFVYASLKHCPFCGSVAVLLFKGNDHTKTRTAKAKCSNVHCRAEITNSALRYDTEWVAKVTIDSWNRREPEDSEEYRQSFFNVPDAYQG